MSMGVVHETPESAITMKRKSAGTQVKKESVNEGMEVTEGLRKQDEPIYEVFEKP